MNTLKSFAWLYIIVGFLSIMVLISGCAGAPKLTPHFLDTQLGELREYEVVDKQNLTIKYKTSHQIEFGQDSYGNGFLCIPRKEAAAWRKYCLDNQCTTPKAVVK